MRRGSVVVPVVALWATALTLGGAASAGPAAAEGAHEHGVAELELVVDGDLLAVDFETPLANLVGFERAPRSEAERRLLATTAERLHNPLGLVEPSPGAGCRVEAVELSWPDFGVSAGGEHAEARASWRYRCAAPQALDRVVALLFDVYPQLHQLRVRWVGPRGQGSARLDSRQRRVDW